MITCIPAAAPLPFAALPMLLFWCTATRVGARAAAIAWVLLAALPAHGDQPDEFFEKRVRPILVARCYECHSSQMASPKGGLRLDSRHALLTGGDTGPAIVPGRPKESLLLDAVNYGELYQMPPKSRLPAEEIAVLTRWVEMGAPWPAETAPMATNSSEFDLAKRKAEHWCWQPVRRPALPPVKNTAWSHDPIDDFILSRLEQDGLSPAPPADDRTLLRRAHFDLLGLPPPPEMLAEQLPYEQVLDRLLASPHFGERWGRHWLDLVRYAESRGHEFDYTIPNAHEYRDYVIRALNADLPYDQFLTEHIAGDLLARPRLHESQRWNESILGTGFWFLGEWVHSPVDIRKDECDRVDNMLDVFSKTFLGLTVACARCHDHKFDAISQRDYYALAGYLQSSSYRLARYETWNQDHEMPARLAALDEKYRQPIAAAVAKTLRPEFSEWARQLAADPDRLDDEFSVLDLQHADTPPILDFTAPASSSSWMTDGPTFGTGAIQPGQLLFTGDDAAPLEVATYGGARRDWTWDELTIAPPSENDSGRLAGWVRAGRTLKSPTFTLQSGYLHYLVEGVGQVYASIASHAMINGPLHAEALKETGGSSDLPLRWITHDLSRYVGQRVHLEFSPKQDEDFRLLMVVDHRQRPSAPSTRPNRWFNDGQNSATDQAAIAKVLTETLDALAAGSIVNDEHRQDRAVIADWLVRKLEPEEASLELKRLLAEHAAARQLLLANFKAASRLAPAMWSGTPVEENLLIRGNHKTPGPTIERRNLEAFGDDSEHTRPPSNDRLELARQMVDRRNPLVSRVIVNRVWAHLMVRGIVPSVDNFGVLGQPPTHPELLDHLADEFMRDGWSVKRLIRRIMLTSSYRMASAGGFSNSSGDLQQQKAERIDPQNSLFHRQNLRRLEGEAIRDAILAASGRLATSMFGPSVPVYLTPFMQGRGRPKESGPLDGAGRRSIYIAVRRNFLSPMMVAFDTPLPFTTIGRRNDSNVPAQALILMNDPFVIEQSRVWARQITADATVSSTQRLSHMYRAALAREPTMPESDSAVEFLNKQAQTYAESQSDPELQAWADLGHVLFNFKEFLIVE